MSNVVYLDRAGSRGLATPDVAWESADATAAAALLLAKTRELTRCLDHVDRAIDTVGDPVLRQVMRKQSREGRQALELTVGELLRRVAGLQRSEC